MPMHTRVKAIEGMENPNDSSRAYSDTPKGKARTRKGTKMQPEKCFKIEVTVESLRPSSMHSAAIFPRSPDSQY